MAAVIGTEPSTKALKDGQWIMVSFAEGELPFEVKSTDLKSLDTPDSKVMMKITNLRETFSLPFIPNERVGLAWIEIIFSIFIKFTRPPCST